MKTISLIFFSLSLILFCGCSDQAPGRKSTLVRDFRLDTLDRERFYLNSHRGRTVLLVFWATSCPQCKKELRDLGALRKLYGENELTLAAICIDPENIASVAPLLEDLDSTLLVLLDRQGLIFRDLQLSSLPSTVLISPSGELAMRFAGYNKLLYKQLAGKVQMLQEKST